MARPLSANRIFLVSAFLFTALQLGLLFLLAWSQRQTELAVAERLAVLVRLALEEKNAAVLSAGLDIAVRELRAEAAVVCDGTLVPCEVPSRRLHRVWQLPLTGKYAIVLQTPVLPEALFFYLSILASLFVSAGSLWFFRRQSETQLRRAVADAVLAQNAQVAHDIQSPLSALLTACQNLDGFSSDEKALVKNAAERITSISQDLLAVNRRYQRGEFDPLLPAPETSQTVSLAPLIGHLVAEKRVEFKSRPAVAIVTEISPGAEAAKVKIRPQGFQRALSNLINNAVESLSGSSGRVGVRVSLSGKWVSVVVADNGQGMSEAVRKQVAQKGGSFGKPNGSGLGIVSARKELGAIGGKLAIRSQTGQGTEVEITLPLVE